jgi:hypothetical protein
MPYFALVILALFAALTITGIVGAVRHFAGKTKHAPSDQRPRELKR